MDCIESLNLLACLAPREVGARPLLVIDRLGSCMLRTSTEDSEQHTLESLFNLAYQTLRQQTRRMLRSFPSVRRWDDTDDVLHGAAMRLCRALDGAPPRSARHFNWLLAQQVRWCLLSLARKYNGPMGLTRNCRDLAGTDPHQSSPLNDFPDTGDDDVTLAEWSEFHRQVEGLPHEIAEVFSLHWYLELSHAEIAESLAVSEVTVRRRWREAKLRLGRYFS